MTIPYTQRVISALQDSLALYSLIVRVLVWSLRLVLLEFAEHFGYGDTCPVAVAGHFLPFFLFSFWDSPYVYIGLLDSVPMTELLY